MHIRIQIIVLILSLLSGLIAIFFVNRMMKKYGQPYLSSYFYFLIFTYIFSVYSIIGSQAVKYFLENQQADPELTNSIIAVLVGLGIPFIILAWYMFLRLSHEMFDIELSRQFVAVYFILFAFTFIGYTLLNIDIGGFELVNFFMETRQISLTYSIVAAAVFGYSLFFIFNKARSLKNKDQRANYIWFMAWYTIISVLSIASLQLTTIHPIFGLIFIAALTGFHLVPALFLNINIHKYSTGRVQGQFAPLSLNEVVEKYEISKREAEIIELICMGLSNQEISDKLFISLQTVKDHVYRIFIKTGVKNRVQLSNLVSSVTNIQDD